MLPNTSTYLRMLKHLEHSFVSSVTNGRVSRLAPTQYDTTRHMIHGQLSKRSHASER